MHEMAEVEHIRRLRRLRRLICSVDELLVPIIHRFRMFRCDLGAVQHASRGCVLQYLVSHQPSAVSFLVQVKRSCQSSAVSFLVQMNILAVTATSMVGTNIYR
jgi:hypothetical protein